MCTVVTRWLPGEPLRILAIRDEFVSREFDTPDTWWPEQPGAVGGRDRVAGGTWCASDIASGTTALLVNRTERMAGTPSRGLLPLAALAAGDDWTARVDHTGMASFTLVLAGPDGVTAWIWDASDLHRVELAPGQHVATSRGIDATDPKTTRFAPLLERTDWLDVVTSCTPSAEPSALVVRHPVDDDVYATVFGQLITAVPGSLRVSWSRTPWLAAGWTEQRWPAGQD